MKRIALVGAVFLSALVVLVWVGVVNASIPVLQVAELLSEEYKGGEVQVDGGKIAKIESYAPLRFSVAAENDPKLAIAVASKVGVPENFKEGIKVSVRGEYDRDTKIFHAYKVSTQCPSRYEATSEVEGTQAGDAAGRAPPADARTAN
jgi:cytochrome c-type biogenesis protein CcmE